MNKRLVWIVTLLFLAAGTFAEAQQTKKVPCIGFLAVSGDPKTPGPWVEAFRHGLRDVGYVEGKSILVEYRYVEGKLDRIPSLVAELMQLKVDVLVLVALSAIRAAKQSTKTIPIVMVATVDPVATGLVDSLAHPGGNITGLTRLTRDSSGKRLELLKEVVPGASRVGVLWETDNPAAAIAFKEYDSAAHALKIQLQSLEIRGLDPDFEGVFQTATKGRANALITVSNVLLSSRYPKQIANLAIKNLLPSMSENS